MGYIEIWICRVLTSPLLFDYFTSRWHDFYYWLGSGNFWPNLTYTCEPGWWLI